MNKACCYCGNKDTNLLGSVIRIKNHYIHKICLNRYQRVRAFQRLKEEESFEIDYAENYVQKSKGKSKEVDMCDRYFQTLLAKLDLIYPPIEIENNE